MENLKKLLAIFLMLTLLVFTLAACNPDTGDGDGEDDDGSGSDDNGDLVLIKGTTAKFKIVKTSSLKAKGLKAIDALVERLGELGVSVEVISDADASLVSDCEVIIGSGVKNREGCDLDVRIVGDEGYLIRVVGNRVVVMPGSDDVAETAINQFLRRTLGIKPSTDELEEDVTVKRDYEYKITTEYPITDVKVGDNSLSDYKLTYDSQDVTVKTVVGVLQDSLVDNAGIWLEAAPAGYTGKEVIVRLVSDAGDEDFRIFIDNDENLVIECSYADGFRKGVEKFTGDVIDGQTGVVRIYKDQPFSFDVKAVWYSDFGAVGDGKADDTYAIVQAHDYANLYGLRVRAEDGKTYRFGPDSHGKRVSIKTDTDWGTAKFIIDDSIVRPYDVAARQCPIFQVDPSLECTPYEVEASKYENMTLTKGQTNIGLTFETDVMLYIIDENDLIYIRQGNNQNDGQPRQEIILVDKNGNVDPSTPILWNYSDITGMMAYPTDETPITVKGGRFTTIANQLCWSFPSSGNWLTGDQYYYYSRGITVLRSNTTVYGVRHDIEGQDDSSDLNGGYPYSGWYDVTFSNNVTFDSCVMTGHKVYLEDRDKNKNGKIEDSEINSGTPMGTYDINANNANAVTWKNCIQSNSITDETNWGIMGSNYCKNLVWDNCSLSRFDAHEGVYNATIKDCEIGFYINAIGAGTLRIENTIKWAGPEFVALRYDYGSTWEGDVIIDGCTHNGWVRRTYQECDKENYEQTGYMFNSQYNVWDFGYTCYMPQNIIINNFKSNIPKIYVFYYSSFTSAALDVNGLNPLQLTKTITVTNKPAGQTYEMLFACEPNNGTYNPHSLMYAQSNLQGPNATVGKGKIQITGIQ